MSTEKLASVLTRIFGSENLDLAFQSGQNKALNIIFFSLKSMRPVDVTTEILIGRPVSEVAGYASNPDKAIQWYTNIKSVKWLPDEHTGKIQKPIAVGSKLAFTAQFLGKRLSYTYEVIEFIPNEKFVMRTADGPFPMETTYSWERISERETRMILRNRGTPSGFSALFAPFMALAMKKENRKDLRRLKDLLEKAR